MKDNYLKLLLLSILFFPWQAFAQVPEPATLRDLIVLGVEQNIGLRVEKLNVPIAGEDVQQNLAVFDAELFASLEYAEASTPVAVSGIGAISDSEIWSGELGVQKKYHSGLMASLSLSTEWSEDNDTTGLLDPEYRSGLDLSLSQPLLRNFGSEVNFTDIKIARNSMSKADLQHQLQAQSLALQIEILAVQLAAGETVADLRTEAVALAEELHKANRRRFVTGIIPVSEVQEAETALANRELNLSLACQQMEINFESLNRQLNHALPGKFTARSLYPFAPLLSEPQFPDFALLFADAKDKSIVLQLADIDVQNFALQQDYSRNQLKPQLDLNLQAGINGLSGDQRSSMTSSRYAGSFGDSFSSTVEGDGYQWGVGLEFSVPWGNRAAKARVRQAALQSKQAKYRERDNEAALKADLKQQLVNLKRTFEQVRLAERFEKLAKLSLEQEQRRLDEGLSDSFRIIAFQDNMINAKIGRINALAQYFISQAQFNFTRGVILQQHNITLTSATEENSREIM